MQYTVWYLMFKFVHDTSVSWYSFDMQSVWFYHVRHSSLSTPRNSVNFTLLSTVLSSETFNAAVNGKLELTHLKGRQRFDTVWRRILRCKNFEKGESWPSLFLDVVNLYLIKFRHRWILNERTFYSFIILFIWKWILT